MLTTQFLSLWLNIWVDLREEGLILASDFRSIFRAQRVWGNRRAQCKGLQVGKGDTQRNWGTIQSPTIRPVSYFLSQALPPPFDLFPIMPSCFESTKSWSKQWVRALRIQPSLECPCWHPQVYFANFFPHSSVWSTWQVGCTVSPYIISMAVCFIDLLRAWVFVFKICYKCVKCSNWQNSGGVESLGFIHSSC